MRWDVGGEDDDLPPLYSGAACEESMASTVTKHNGHPRNPGFPRIMSSSKHSLEDVSRYRLFGFGLTGVRTWTKCVKNCSKNLGALWSLRKKKDHSGIVRELWNLNLTQRCLAQIDKLYVRTVFSVQDVYSKSICTHSSRAQSSSPSIFHTPMEYRGLVLTAFGPPEAAPHSRKDWNIEDSCSLLSGS
jgi:hypothetical protein